MVQRGKEKMRVEIMKGKVVITPEEKERIKQIFIYTNKGVSIHRDKLDRLHITVIE